MISKMKRKGFDHDCLKLLKQNVYPCLDSKKKKIQSNYLRINSDLTTNFNFLKFGRRLSETNRTFHLAINDICEHCSDHTSSLIIISTVDKHRFSKHANISYSQPLPPTPRGAQKGGTLFYSHSKSK